MNFWSKINSSLKQLPNIEESVVNNIKDRHQEDEIDEEIVVKNIKPSWEGKILSLPKLKVFKGKLERWCYQFRNWSKWCSSIRNRKRFLQLLPIFRKDIRDKINYDQIKCFAIGFNLKTIWSFQRYKNIINLCLINILLVNQYLYQFTYGVLKYQIPVESYVDEKDIVITASLNNDIFIDMMQVNNSFKGKLYQLKITSFLILKQERILIF